MTEAHFLSMRQGATFINTGRGAQVNEAGLLAALQARPDLTALLDVQHPEPPEAGSPLYTQPNIHLTSHIAGSLNDEVLRMPDYMIEDFKRWQAGKPLLYQVDPASLGARA
jgi:phosphoglycerate dehydrogenase-like enzyme